MNLPSTIPRLAVGAAIFRDGHVLLARRARDPSRGLYSLPGGRVEPGETLVEAVLREVAEETGLTIALRGLAGYRDAIQHHADGSLAHHFVIIAFAAEWRGGDVRLDPEHDDHCWRRPDALDGLALTEGLPTIVAEAWRLVQSGR